MSKRAITEYLVLDPQAERWSCSRCGADLGNARDNYKRGCLIAARDPRQVHPPIVEDAEYSFAPDPNWCRIVEFYCPNCSTLIETEYLPPGHPLTHDIELDIDALKEKQAAEEQSR